MKMHISKHADILHHDNIGFQMWITTLLLVVILDILSD